VPRACRQGKASRRPGAPSRTGPPHRASTRRRVRAAHHHLRAHVPRACARTSSPAADPALANNLHAALHRSWRRLRTGAMHALGGRIERLGTLDGPVSPMALRRALGPRASFQPDFSAARASPDQRHPAPLVERPPQNGTSALRVPRVDATGSPEHLVRRSISTAFQRKRQCLLTGGRERPTSAAQRGCVLRRLRRTSGDDEADRTGTARNGPQQCEQTKLCVSGVRAGSQPKSAVQSTKLAQSVPSRALAPRR
jgi:hypothetical protein